MSKEKNLFKKGDTVFHKEYGEGVVASVEKVELPSDNDPVMYVVVMKVGRNRHLKNSELEA